MEKGVGTDLASYISDVFKMQEVDINSYSPLTLAYIGDCVFDLVIKSMILSHGNKQVQKLHKETSSLVQASSQSRMMRVIQEHLTSEEQVIFRRGRNAKSVSPAKNQSLTDYRRATGFEALIGYLYLNKNYERLVDLIKIGLDSIEEEQI